MKECYKSPKGFKVSEIDESKESYTMQNLMNQHFKGALREDYLFGYEIEYNSTGLTKVNGRKRIGTLEKLVARLRSDADFIEKYMINESTDQK